MKGRDIIKEIMKRKNVSNADMASRLDITQAALWDRLNTKKTKDIPVSTLNDMARVLDYKVVVVPRSSRVSDESFVIDNSYIDIDLDALLSDEPQKENKIKLSK